MNMAALRLAAGLLLAMALGACSGPGPHFTILSGSENDILEPMVQEFCQSRRATCTVKYLGSLDIALALKAGNDPQADAVWPAASIWIDMFDTARRVKSVKSIAQMPVISSNGPGQALGWIGAVTTQNILAAVESGRLKFLVTSAQSNSGASAYLAMLASGIGKPDLIRSGDLDKPDVLATDRGLLLASALLGISGWL
jgi:Ca-activated chloride channel family protein